VNFGLKGERGLKKLDVEKFSHCEELKQFLGGGGGGERKKGKVLTGGSKYGCSLRRGFQTFINI